MDYAGYVKLGVFWNKRHLTGPFWRLYHHDDPGAGLCVNGKRIEILPGSFYILPPHCNRLTWCSRVPFQLYIHFELSMSMGNPRFPCHVIPLTDDMRPVLTELRQSLKGGRPDCLHNSLLASYKRYFYNYQPDMHLKTLKNLATWGKEAKIASLKEDFAKLKPHMDRISAKNQDKWADFVKTYDGIVKGL